MVEIYIYSFKHKPKPKDDTLLHLLSAKWNGCLSYVLLANATFLFKQNTFGKYDIIHQLVNLFMEHKR
ncbi:hypothetical protein AZ602_04585 [Moraxella sp. RCAD0137]|nr:hypothetical protein AZ602_04585 [Moraxella sp. RCAD0137]